MELLKYMSKKAGGSAEFFTQAQLTEYFKKLTLASQPIVSGELPGLIKDIVLRQDPQYSGEVYVIDSADPNAFCLPNGDIFLHTGLLAKLTTTPQLKFILGHERSHIRKAAQQIIKVQSLEEYISQARLEEYVADAESFKELDDQDENPLEGVDALEILNSRHYGGVVHGDTIHRILNLHWMTKFIDLKNITKTSQTLDLPLDNLHSTDVPDLGVFSNLSSDSQYAYRRELKKCTDLFSTIAVYQQVMNAWNEHLSLERNYEELESPYDLKQDSDNAEGADDDFDMIGDDDFDMDLHNISDGVYDDSSYNPTIYSSIGETETPEEKNFNSLRYDLFDILVDHCKAQIHKKRFKKSPNAGIYLAEAVRVFCCGDPEPQIGSLKEFTPYLNPRYFSRLGLAPTFVDAQYLDQYVNNLYAKVSPSSKEQKSFLQKVEALAQAKNLEFTSPVSDKIGELYGEFEKIFKSTGMMKTEFTPEFKDGLIGKTFPEIAASLHQAKIIYDLVEGGAALEEWYGIGDNRIITLETFSSDTTTRSEEALHLLEVTRMAMGHRLDYHFIQIPAMQTEGLIQDLIGADYTLADFKEALNIITGRTIKERYPLFSVERLDRLTEAILVESIRCGMIFSYFNQQDWAGLAQALEESIALYPPSPDPTLGFRIPQGNVDHKGRPINKGNTYMGIYSSLPDDLVLQTFMSFMLDPIESSVEQKKLLPLYLKEQPFDGAVDFLSTHFPHVHSAEPFEYLLEERAQTNEELETAAQLPEKFIEVLGRDRRTEIRSITLLEMINRYRGINRLELLKTALDKHSNYSLKRFVYEGIIDSVCRELSSWQEQQVSDFDLFDLANSSDYKYHVFKPDLSDGPLIDMGPLYDLGILHRYALIRLLLADPREGLLINNDYRQNLAPELLEELVEARTDSDNQFLDVLKTIFSAYIEKAPLQSTYFTLFPLLLEHALHRPHKDSSERRVFFDAWGERWCNTARPEWDDNRRKEFIFDLHEQADIQDRNFKPNPIDEKQELNKEHLNILAQKYSLKEHDLPFLEAIIKKSFTFFDEEKIYALKEDMSSTKKLSVPEFLTSTARNLGSPGVRFLQLFGQFVELPSAYELAFQEVYDSVAGQSKVTAYKTTTREIHDFKEQFSGLGDRMGGGSITTVYETTKKEDNSEWVVKVLNPNAEYNNNLAFDLLEDILTDLAAKDKDYNSGLSILADIREWIEGDIGFEGFEELDTEFRSVHQGFTGEGGYSIIVPESGINTKHVKLERKVGGTNLTQLDELVEQGHDHKAIISTIAKNYVAQLQQGVVHSDVHPGNFRITPDKEVAILDRNFYLQFSEEEREALQGLVMSSLIGDADAFTNSVQGLINYDGNGEVRSLIDELFSQEGSLADKVVNLVRELRSKDVDVPLKLTLLIRNIHSLHQFSKQAGFNGLEDALSFVSA